jgi:hypothetical protein
MPTTVELGALHSKGFGGQLTVECNLGHLDNTKRCSADPSLGAKEHRP